MATYVTLAQVKGHLHITSTADDVDLQAKADQAEAKVIGWCRDSSARVKALVETWTDATTVPLVVVAAILMQVGELYRFRGDEPDGPPRQDGEELSVQIREMLRAYHDPGIA